MKIVGAGLSKTGTTSLHRALEMLGLSSLHYDERRLNDVVDGTAQDADFRRYDDVDAVLDIPTALFYEQLLEAYPKSKCILTVRDEQQWWDSIEHHFNWKSLVRRIEDNPFKWRVRHLAYGSATASEALFRERYRRHNQRVVSTVPANRLLVMDIAEGDGWDALCPFLQLPIPELPFPHTNRRLQYVGGESLRLMTGELLALIPSGDRFIWVDECQLPALQLPQRTVIPFLESAGEYAGPPADSRQAIAACERLRQEGADWIVVAWPALWWLDFYRGFYDYLCESFSVCIRNERMIAFDLRTRRNRSAESEQFRRDTPGAVFQ